VTILVSTLQRSSMLPHLAHISTYPRIMSLQEIELSGHDPIEHSPSIL
jgi:hypothetical protein